MWIRKGGLGEELSRTDLHVTNHVGAKCGKSERTLPYIHTLQANHVTLKVVSSCICFHSSHAGSECIQHLIQIPKPCSNCLRIKENYFTENKTA